MIWFLIYARDLGFNTYDMVFNIGAQYGFNTKGASVLARSRARPLTTPFFSFQTIFNPFLTIFNPFLTIFDETSIAHMFVTWRLFFLK
jgi:hypothetical protein